MSIGRLIALSAITPSPTNPRKRFNADDLQELANSIKLHGVMQPILVRPTNSLEVAAGTAPFFEYEIVAGERRYRAAKLAELEYIPAIEKELSDIETMQLQIIANMQRADLHPMEEAAGFKALLENKDAGSWDADQLAEKISKSRSYVYNSLKLNELCTYAKDMFFDGKYGREIALLIARIPGAKLQQQAAKQIIELEMSYRSAKNYIRNNFTLDLNKAPWDKISTTLYPPAGSCLSCPKRTGNYPELYPDIDSADVCTDTACFAAKKVAHASVIIASNPRTIHGEEAKKVAPYGANYAYVTEGYTSNLDNLHYQGHEAKTILGEETPEPYILIDDKNNIKPIYKKAEIKTLMAQKIQEKIDAGELTPPPAKEKEQWQIEREEKEAAQAVEVARRVQMFLRLFSKIDESHTAVILQLAILVFAKDRATNTESLTKSMGLTDVNDIYLHDIHQAPRATQLKILAMFALCDAQHTRWAWKSESDNETDEDYQYLLSFIDNLGLNRAEFLTAELPLTPDFAAQAGEITAEDGAAVETSAPVKAKRGRPSQKAVQEESASADV